ncbi:MAG: ABC transporter ATP-binding protein [Anaerolineae bacterium]|jgi:putative ABC transport system ATP-binding protein|nr:ABC transporter ATP-binding protein [Anaerolineae bacterium]MBT7191178.1 ABC transporter ATP-binding protein [Anaerolineae bacterium]MBT7988419.1 ABC transporter ATP-binding protein [Anaerolineae bacterium]
MIVTKNLMKVYQMGDTEVRALDGVSLTIDKGELISIMGPSGSGKSTLMNIIGCLDTPTDGDYLLDDEKVATMGEDELATVRGKKIGFVFQQFNLLPRTSALDNVMLPLLYQGLSSKERSDRAARALGRVGLGDRMDHHPNELSGGQQQRVAIARSLVNDPAILLADEPTGALDSKTGADIMRLFDSLHKESGQTIILVTHDRFLAEHAKRIIRLSDGKISSDEINKKTIKPGTLRPEY